MSTENLTVGALKALLADVPDEYVVVAYAAGDPSVGISEATFDVAGGVTSRDYDDDLNEVILPEFVLTLRD